MPEMSTSATNRLIIYLSISLLMAIQNELIRIVNGEFFLTGWVEYVIFFISIILPPLIVLRAFMDTSINAKTKIENAFRD